MDLPISGPSYSKSSKKTIEKIQTNTIQYNTIQLKHNEIWRIQDFMIQKINNNNNKK